MFPERELTLDEILSDPIVRQVMKADGVTAEDISRLHRSSASKGDAPPAHMCARVLETNRT